jgi:uncharacterized protein
MLKQLLICTLLLSVNGLVSAAITIKTQQEIKVAEINGQTVAKNLFGQDSSQYQLNQGVNELEVSYSQYFDAEDGIGAHDIVRSAPVKIKTPILQDHETYTLALIDTPKTNEQAKVFAKQPIFALYNRNNELLMTQYGSNDGHQGIVNTLLDNKQSNKQNFHPTNKQPEAIYTAIANVPKDNSNPKNKNNRSDVNQLISIWEQASKADRQKFMIWLAEQTN